MGLYGENSIKPGIDTRKPSPRVTRKPSKRKVMPAPKPPSAKVAAALKKKTKKKATKKKAKKK